MNDDGVYNFGHLARVLMSAVRNAPKLSKIEVIETIKKVSCGPFVRALDKSEKPHFWEAIIEQLRLNGYLKTKYVPFESAGEKIMLELTKIGREWLLSSSKEKLELKAVGLMYAFFKKKRNSSFDQSPESYFGDDSDGDTDSDTKEGESPLEFDFEEGVPVVGIDTFYGNVVDDYDPEVKTSSSENDDTESGGYDSDVIFVGCGDNAVIVSDDDENFAPKWKRAKFSTQLE